MKKSLKHLFFYFVLCALYFSPAFSADAEKANAMDDFLKNLDGFQAGFTQTLFNEQGEILETSSGIVYMQYPGKFHWKYRDPYSQLIITDGDTLWLYDKDLEQVTIRDVSASIENTPAAILSGEENIDKHFIVEKMGDIEGYEWIELIPKDAEDQYKNIRLGFDGRNIGMMVLHDNLGQVTRIDFNNIQRGKELDPALFTFEPPSGIDVIDDRG